MQTRTPNIHNTDWPPLPANGVFPETLSTVEVAQLLRYDADGTSVERARRNVQWLVRERGLPVLGPVGQKYVYSKQAVLAWLAARGKDNLELPKSADELPRQAKWENDT
jgi:hypothetical protein